MIYSLSGAQGQGKSEMTSFFQEEGYCVFPMCAAPANISSEEEFQLYQENLAEEKYSSILSLVSEIDTDIVLESSFIDIFVYSIMILGVHHDYSEWMQEMYDRCLNYQTVVDKVILFPLKENNDSAMNKFSTESFNVLLDYYYRKNDITIYRANNSTDIKNFVTGEAFHEE